jgi:hypothetical protein
MRHACAKKFMQQDAATLALSVLTLLAVPAILGGMNFPRRPMTGNPRCLIAVWLR